MSDAFLERDFKAYERHFQDDPEYNSLRLAVRRKLKAMVDAAAKDAKEVGVELSAQAGLHHPYLQRVSGPRTTRVFVSQSEGAQKAVGVFGEALGKDAETHYIQTVLEACIDDQIVECALRIHPQAWWDGENFKKQATNDPVKLEQLTVLLRALPSGFNLRVHDWKKDNWCASTKSSELKETLKLYTPGNHWLHIQRQLPKEDALLMGAEASAWVKSSLLSLLAVYKFALWEPS